MYCKESQLRTIIKTIGFKILTTSITAFFTGLSGAIKIHLILTLVYLLYERVWNKINWGRIYEKERGIILTKKSQ